MLKLYTSKWQKIERTKESGNRYPIDVVFWKWKEYSNDIVIEVEFHI